MENGRLASRGCYTAMSGIRLVISLYNSAQDIYGLNYLKKKTEEDHSPVIQLWDLRFATSPLKTLENHQRGILAISWCEHDSDLLVSCGKDDRILCWNPNSSQPNGEVLSEIAKTNQWSFDLVWSPRNPVLIASPNYDGHVAIYSLMGGKSVIL